MVIERARHGLRRLPMRATRRLLVAPGRRPGLLHSMLLGAVLFAIGTVTGALLSGTAPAGHTPPGRDAAPVPAAASSARPPDADPVAAQGTDQAFARSMIYSGGVALVLSVVGMVMVGRRRRLW